MLCKLHPRPSSVRRVEHSKVTCCQRGNVRQMTAARTHSQLKIYALLEDSSTDALAPCMLFRAHGGTADHGV